MSNSSDDIVFPAKKIGVEEEFLPSSTSTYVEDHEVRSALVGRVYIDRDRYQAKVFPLAKGGVIPRRYDIVIGQVIKVSRSSLRISIGYVNNRPLIPAQSGIMHISDSSKDYIKELDEYYCAGDIIRAKIIDAKTYPLQLECKANNLGVIYATCIQCGEELKKIKKNLLQCEECGYKQTRATTVDYGNITFLPEY